MEFKDVLMTRRSVRKFKPDKLSHEDLAEILECACMAPSGVNLQPWYFVVLESEEAVEYCRQLFYENASDYRARLEKRFPNHPQVVEDTLKFMSSFGGAPVLVLAFMQKEQYGEPIKCSQFVQSAGAAIENLLLAAWDKGIGSCWMTAILDIKKIASAFEEKYGQGKGPLVAAISLGYPDESPRAPKRRDNRVVFY